MSIDIDTARKVAKLARIRVEEEALPALARELSGILTFMEQLNEVDVDGIEPMVSVTPMRLKRRQDVVTDGNLQAEVLKNAPEAREGFFAVPKVVE
ncbi:Asp-tRNA(Asn)/Glu-tRNA(Gln) amidotransferase subunit GatC [Pseudogemmobacter faecipullorum]|uniref:Aspartyl/glutamyl-tRNA(Asn/Gln) amidotransferase subunit C n=1 Tax=Pseudogemmobacter faecipullorum TaxID=2755041 RepID=A0ABS8CLG9_9RHOB|nr:Asp-tRNA(Asn)/Glu-tRNA(Gln) amidotransferase subunit GatC [Pseudogemmobacter faecipullorum]MCB5410229.1 Asp-tRNA(Asn)/Glu-tRNA(Gln) amidotransferase subunit GatC [Pseudogemmobacter faecipullorum]